MFRYGLTIAAYDALAVSQGGRCAICRREEVDGSLAVDHDHACCPGRRSCGQCVRGLLCRACNYALGLLDDDVTRIRAAAAYLS